MMPKKPVFPVEWNIGSFELLADTHSSLVWKVERIDHPGEVFVVKQLKPAGMEELRGAHYLAWQDGHGAARLYALDGASMLLEYVGDYHLARRLLATPHETIPLHGDIHHENIIKGPRGWLAIDPHGVAGDAAFDAANIFYNPLDRDDLCLDLERARRMAEHFAPIIGRDPAYILDYAFAYGCLSAAWHREDGNDADEARELKIASALRHLRRTSYPS